MEAEVSGASGKKWRTRARGVSTWKITNAFGGPNLSASVSTCDKQSEREGEREKEREIEKKLSGRNDLTGRELISCC